MKYKVGDRVKIVSGNYNPDVEETLKKTNRILTIKGIVKNSYYIMEEIKYEWDDFYIENLIIPTIIQLAPTNKRFELMDI